MGGNSDRLVRIGVAHDEVEANIWRDVLEQEGIAVYVKNVDPLSTLGAAPSLPGSFELYVFAADEKRARWLLGDSPGGEKV